jgi:hypothetical protein
MYISIQFFALVKATSIGILLYSLTSNDVLAELCSGKFENYQHNHLKNHIKKINTFSVNSMPETSFSRFVALIGCTGRMYVVRKTGTCEQLKRLFSFSYKTIYMNYLYIFRFSIK